MRKRVLRRMKCVEDVLEDMILISAALKEPTMKIDIIEEKEESVRLRITVIMDGEEKETIEEAPKPLPTNLIRLYPVKVEALPQLTKQFLPRINVVYAQQRFPTLYEVAFPSLSLVMTSYSMSEKLKPIYLPWIPNMVYSWSQSEIKALIFISQKAVFTLIPGGLLSLFTIAIKMPSIGKISASPRLTPLITEKFMLQKHIKASITENLTSIRNMVLAEKMKGKWFLDYVVTEEKEKPYNLTTFAGKLIGEPIIIILPETKHCLWYLFWVLCRELYREAKGSLPTSAVFTGYPPKIFLEGFEVWLRLFGTISNNIVIIRDEHLELGKWIKRKLSEMFSQELGFLIVIAKNVSGIEDKIKDLCKPYIPKIFSFRLTLSDEEFFTRVRKMLSVIFGVPENQLPPSMDMLVASLDRGYRNFLDEMLTSRYLAHTRRDISEKESEDHIALKTLAIKYLHEKMNIDLKNIICTCKVGEQIIADIYVEDKALAVECETLFGVGATPLFKIFETARKYVERSLDLPVKEIWIIVRNWSAALHLGDLYWAEKVLEKELKEKGKNVRIFIPDIYAGSLVLLDEIINKIYGALMRRR